MSRLAIGFRDPEKAGLGYVLRMEPPVPNFNAWKKAFDRDPIGRERLGVRRHQVLRPTDDANDALIDLEFDSATAAEACLAALRTLWGRVQGTFMTDSKVRMLTVVEDQQF